MSKELKKIVKEMYGAYKEVEEGTDEFKSKMDDINTFNTLFEGIVDYTYSQTEEEKQQSMIQIMQSSFNFGEKLPDAMGDGLLKWGHLF